MRSFRAEVRRSRLSEAAGRGREATSRVLKGALLLSALGRAQLFRADSPLVAQSSRLGRASPSSFSRRGAVDTAAPVEKWTPQRTPTSGSPTFGLLAGSTR